MIRTCGERSRQGSTGFEHNEWKWMAWLTPIYNFFKPYHLLSEIYRLGGRNHSSGESWKEEGRSWWLLGWWIFWVVAHIVMGALWHRLTSSPETLLQASSMYTASVAAAALSIAIAGLWFPVASKLTERLVRRRDAHAVGQPAVLAEAQAPSIA
jgi:hypothetical protein